MLRWIIPAVLLIQSAAWGQTNTLRIPDRVELGRKIVATCDCVAPPGGRLSILWNASIGVDSEQLGNKLCIWAPPGTHQIDAVVIPLRTVTVGSETFDVIAGEILRLDARFQVVGEIVPPDPGPGPEPDPDPQPDPDLPFDAPGLTVILIYETQEPAGMTAGQRAIIQSPAVRKWLNDNCHREGSGLPYYRFWDDDYTEFAGIPATVAEAYRETKRLAAGKLPYLAISNGKQGWHGQPPDGVQAFLELAGKYKD